MAYDVGVVTCVDAKTGERVWRERLADSTQRRRSLATEDHLFSESGEAIVLRAANAGSDRAQSGRRANSCVARRGEWTTFIRTDDQIVAVGQNGGLICWFNRGGCSNHRPPHRCSRRAVV
jgi:outer membrane protein assembly factor BamB